MPGRLDGDRVAVADSAKAEQIRIQRRQASGRILAEGRPVQARAGMQILDVPGIGVDNLRYDSNLFQNRRERQHAERDVGGRFANALAFELHRIFEIGGGRDADQANLQWGSAVIPDAFGAVGADVNGDAWACLAFRGPHRL
jgi:hypothetical protein